MTNDEADRPLQTLDDPVVEAPEQGSVLYRFRSCDSLFGFKELERLQIYLACADELNDPMEGYKDAVWRGDSVLWENLLRHYILALLLANIHLLLTASFEEPPLNAAMTADDLPTDAFRAVYAEACNEFLAQPGPARLSSRLAELAKPLRGEGLRLVLTCVHAAALRAVLTTLEKRGLMPAGSLPPIVEGADPDAVLAPYSRDATEAVEVDFETIAFAANHSRRELALQMEYQVANDATRRKLSYLMLAFPDRYVDGLVEQLIHPPWRTACFSGSCNNASNWAVYGDQHRGVALMFRLSLVEGAPSIPLVGAIGSSSVVGQPSRTVRGKFAGLLHRVTYSERPPEVDFFQSLGALPMRKLASTWHAPRGGQRSMMLADPTIDKVAWRKAYWESFRGIATTKLQDWKHEEEYRLFAPDMLGLLAENKENALVEYELSSLAGIVFGLRTSTAHKVEIMRIVEARCKLEKRDDFGFYQMSYSAQRGQLLRL